MSALIDFWRGHVPLSRAFWTWGILGGALVGALSSILSLVLLANGAPGWLAVTVLIAHIPWNIFLLIGVWRSSERAEASASVVSAARMAMVVWVIVLSVV
jgi:hypothetical protein